MKKILKLFGFRKEVHSLRTEIFSGFSTFIVMAYILSLAPSAFTGIGGTEDPFPVSALFAAVALVSALSSFIMAFYAHRPMAVAPGVGLLFFITGTVCTTMGYSWHFALTAVFLEGILFTLMTFTGLRTLIVETIPLSLRSGIGVGVGFFLASLGLKNAGMLDSGSAILSLASMVTEPEKLLVAICVLLAGVLIICRIKGAIFIALVLSTLIGIPLGVTHFDGIVKLPDSPAPLFCQMDWGRDVFSVDMVVCIISILFLDVFDTIGTTIGVLSGTSLTHPNGRVSGMSRILQVDAISSMLSGIFGTTTCTSYLESAAGVTEGGRTGVTPFISGCCFLLALLFSPVFLAIPSAATGAILLIVSVQMFTAVKHINFTDPVEAIPSVLTILIMAIVGSISDGIVVGVITYAVLHFVSDMIEERRQRKEGKIFTQVRKSEEK